MLGFNHEAPGTANTSIMAMLETGAWFDASDVGGPEFGRRAPRNPSTAVAYPILFDSDSLTGDRPSYVISVCKCPLVEIKLLGTRLQSNAKHAPLAVQYK
jgi:hypothetical protein